MNEDFAPFELAVKLKEKGFPQHQCDEVYIADNDYEIEIGSRWHMKIKNGICNSII